MARGSGRGGVGEPASLTPETAGSSAGGAGVQAVDLSGDSQELVAFVLLRYVAQLERQSARTGGAQTVFDRKWLLDAYAECLEVVKGERGRAAAKPARKA